MLNKLRELQYKTIPEFPEQMRERLYFLVSKRFTPENSTYYVKVLDEEIQYELDSGAIISHRISLALFFLVDEINDDMYDCYATPTFPFDLRVQEDFSVLQNLFNIYKNDVKEVFTNETEPSEAVA